jgi:molybdopterin converting factor subunit 1
MKVRIKLFAVARQRVGRDHVEVELPERATVRQLRGALVEQFAPLAEVIPYVRFAINSEYASEAAPIPAVGEIAIIPPVSGG